MNSSYSPYLFRISDPSSPFITNNKSLTIEAGVTIYVDDGISINNWNDLIINGTSDNHVKITSNSGTPAAGDWSHLYAGTGDYTTSISYLDIEYYSYIQLYGTGSCDITDSTFSNFSTTGINSTRNAPVNIFYCTIDGSGSGDRGIYLHHAILSVTDIVSFSVIKNCSYGVGMQGKAYAEITYTDFINNQNQNVYGSSSADLTLTNNYWDYTDTDVNSGNYDSKLKINTNNLTGTITWSPYSTSQVSGAGPR